MTGRPGRSEARAIAKRTSQLPLKSKVLYRVDHFAATPAVALGGIGAVLSSIVVGAVLGFPSRWVDGFEVAASSIALLVLLAIQHTEQRQQAATQRKLDELLRAIPDAQEELILLEEAPRETILEVEETHREHLDELREEVSGELR